MTDGIETLHSRLIRGRRLACVGHETSGDTAVLFCHGFRGEKTGPNRTFVTAARQLARRGISSLRFDQYGSGDSAGRFMESRFTDWVSSIGDLSRELSQQHAKVVLWGQSMGASAAISAAADVEVAAVVAWVPDASTDPFHPGPHGFVEEGGQRVANAYWEQAHAAAIPDRLRSIAAPCYLVFGTADEYVSDENRAALIDASKASDRVDVFDGYPHSAWTAYQADEIIDRSIRFVQTTLGLP